MSNLFDEWSSKEQIGIKTKKKYNQTQDEIKYKEKDYSLTTSFLKKTANHIIFGQHPIEEDYQIRDDEKTLLFFHFKFVEKLGIQDQVGTPMDTDDEKYYMIMPLQMFIVQEMLK